jgi:ABC-type methionine transport system ATPase subunit
MVTHGVSHLSKCDGIIIVSHGEIVDQGSYNDLMIRSNILQDFVRSVATSSTDQYQRQASSYGKKRRNTYLRNAKICYFRTSKK